MDALAYFHMWDREAAVLRELLNQTFFCRGRRGKWWDRLALILMEHGLRDGSLLSVKQESGEVDPATQDSDEDIVIITGKKPNMDLCRREALRICWKGLDDKWCHLGMVLIAICASHSAPLLIPGPVERHSLQRRVARLESMLKVPQEDRHISPAQLNTATDIIIEGEQVGDRITGKKARWKSTLEPAIDVEELDLPAEVSVEELSLQHYRARGWQGFVCDILHKGV